MSSGAVAQPLRPGYPAGVKAAQESGVNTWMLLGGTTIFGVAGYLISQSVSTSGTNLLAIKGGNSAFVPPNSTAVSTSTTGTR
ncbi:MAG: hypothetical protein EOP38_28495 [Rubrivivax sp.]|nr:MAG: hypothetical protein EOP38_28495 [Rubrivivax sp.]